MRRTLSAALAAGLLLLAGCHTSEPSTVNYADLPPPPPSGAPDATAPQTYESPVEYVPAERSPASPPPADALHFRHAEPGAGEDYKPFEDNGWATPARAPLSTFAVDVDRASYSNVRRFLLDGQAPPPDAVRVEEMINYFPYRYAEPDGRDPVRITAEVGVAPWNAEHRLVRVGLKAREVDFGSAPPANLVFLVDVSGSMDEPAKLPLVQASLRLLVRELRPQDRVSLVVYAGAAGRVLPPTSGADKAAILGAIDRLQAGGSTAGGDGIRLAYKTAREAFVRGGSNRVILATDGDFNVGVSSESDLVRLVEHERTSGVYLTVLGFGTGNLQDREMQALADHGNGHHAYVDNLLEARKTLVDELGGTLLTVAKDVKAQVEFNPARVAAYRLVGYENRVLQDWEFNDDTRDGGEMGAGHTVTVLYEVVPTGVGTALVDPLRYAPRPATPPAAAASGELLHVKVRYQPPTGGASRLLTHAVPDRVAAPSADFRFASAVAAFGMLLRGSPHRGTATLADVVALAREGRGDDPDGYRAEFVRLVEAYRGLQARTASAD